MTADGLPRSPAALSAMTSGPDDCGRLTWVFPWRLNALDEVRQKLAVLVQSECWSDELHHQALLVIEELIVNAVTYGGQTPESGVLEVALQSDPELLHIHVRDNGVAFDPFALTNPDTEASLEERRIGGLGLFLVKQLSVIHGYRYTDGMNCVHVGLPRAGQSTAVR